MFTSHIMLKVFRCWYFHTHINIRWGYEKDILTVASLTRSMSVDILSTAVQYCSKKTHLKMPVVGE